MKTLLVLALVIFLVGSTISCVSSIDRTVAQIQEDLPESPVGETRKAAVVRVIDGDTIEVNIEGEIFSVRYIGIDTPETVHPTRGEEPCGKEASDKNRELVEGNVVELEKDVSETDKYGRLLRYVYVGDIFVNAELVRLGYAQVATYPPDVKYQDSFLQLQKEAREASRGCWRLEEETTELTPTKLPTPSESSNVKITKIFYDGLVPRIESDEYVEITNIGSTPVDLNDWVVKDISEGYPSLTFPAYILQPGKSVRVYTNEIHPEYGGFSFGSGQPVWNNTSPDTAVLYNTQGREVSRKSY